MNLPYNPKAFVPAQPTPVDPVVIAIDLLKTNLSHLDSRDQTFAKSLMESHTKYGRLSEKQTYWVGQLSAKAQRFAIASAIQAPLPLAASVPQVPHQLAPGFARVVELFNKASDLMAPKIRLETDTGQKVILRRLGPSSKTPGQISVTDASRSFESRRYFGRVDLSGSFHPGRDNTPDVAKLLEDLAREPVKMAALYGHKTSNCCFCGLALTTSESVTAGYGPICAARYGMPWGEDVQTTYTKVTLKDE